MVNYVCERWELTPVCGKRAVLMGNKKQTASKQGTEREYYRMKYIQGCEGSGLNANYLLAGVI